MPPRLRKLVGSVGVVGFLLAYIMIVTVLADHVPPQRWLQTLFFLITGVIWGAPLIPLIRWMNGGGEPENPTRD